jgi:hypothetical protein
MFPDRIREPLTFVALLTQLIKVCAHFDESDSPQAAPSTTERTSHTGRQRLKTWPTSSRLSGAKWSPSVPFVARFLHPARYVNQTRRQFFPVPKIHKLESACAIYRDLTRLAECLWYNTTFRPLFARFGAGLNCGRPALPAFQPGSLIKRCFPTLPPCQLTLLCIIKVPTDFWTRRLAA